MLHDLLAEGKLHLPPRCLGTFVIVPSKFKKLQCRVVMFENFAMSPLH